MKRKSFPILSGTGPDVDIETSLKEYGLWWIEKDNEVLFYYGIDQDEEEYFQFDFCTMPKDIEWTEEWDWVDFAALSEFIGQDIREIPFPYVICDLISYYGYNEIFGESYWEGLTYQELFFGKN